MLGNPKLTACALYLVNISINWIKKLLFSFTAMEFVSYHWTFALPPKYSLVNCALLLILAHILNWWPWTSEFSSLKLFCLQPMNVNLFGNRISALVIKSRGSCHEWGWLLNPATLMVYLRGERFRDKQVVRYTYGSHVPTEAQTGQVWL